MKIKMVSLYSKMLSFFLVVLGFSSCTDEPTIGFQPMYGCPAPEYGAPYAQVKVSGKVVDKDSKEPISGIGVILDDEDNYYRNDTVFTDDSGVFNFNIGTIGAEPKTLNIVFQDMDGELNGEYISKEKIVKVETSDYNGGSGNWNDGEAVVDMKQIELTPKKENE